MSSESLLSASTSSTGPLFYANRFHNQIAIITGGAQGIGYAIAERLVKENATVILFDINAQQLKHAQSTLHQLTNTPTFTSSSVPSSPLVSTGLVDICLVDVTDESSVMSGVSNVLSKYHHIDVLVNCAGITGKTGIDAENVDLNDFNRVMAINLNGTFLCIKHIIPSMKSRNYGRVVNIASISGKEGNAQMLAYSASKAAVIGLTKVIGKECAAVNQYNSNVTVNCICPAVVMTDLVRNLPEDRVKYMTDKIPMKRCCRVEEVAAVVSFIASKECSFCTGAVFDASGGRATY